MKKSLNNTRDLHLERKNLRKEITKYFRNWPWFFVSLLVCLSSGFLFLRYATPQYSATTTIILKDETSRGPESLILAEFGFSNSSMSKTMENELAILRSRRLMKDVVKSLNLNIQYFVEGKVNILEIYEDIPFSLQVLRIDELRLKEIGGARIQVQEHSPGEFIIHNIKTERTIRAFDGKPVDLGFASVVLGNLEEKPSGAVIVQFSEVENMAAHYRNQINFIQQEKNSNLIELRMTDAVKEKARDILDQLILEYNRAAIEDKNLIAGNTANFINDRLAIINEELDSVETGKEIFKEQNHLTDIQAESQMFIQNASDYNRMRQEVGTQLELANAMLEYISSNTKNDLLPSNLGLSDGGVTGQIDEYNDLVLQRNRLLAGSSEKNPIVIKINRQIDQIKGNVMQSLTRMRSNLKISQEDLDRQASSIGSKIFAVPSKERQYRGIERQQNIKETLYLFLLQKREENSLSMAVMEPKAKVVDRAYFHDYPIYPNSRSIYLGTFVLGLFIPVSIIYTKELLDNKVRKRSDLENISPHMVLVGEVPKIREKQKIITRNDRSVLAESYRILSTNLQYLLVNSKEGSMGKILVVTSTIKGEGKTFTAVNLAITLANISKKVLLIGVDLRSPKLAPHMDKVQKKGVSDYLVNDDLLIEDLITRSNLHPQLDILISGHIPPNPYELLKTQKVKKMFDEVRPQYDYIIVDTAPLMLVADTFLLTPYADTILYVVKAGYTEKELLEFPLNTTEKGKLKNISFVLNNVNKTNLGYGSKYGYGYGVERKRSQIKNNSPVFQ